MQLNAVSKRYLTLSHAPGEGKRAQQHIMTQVGNRGMRSAVLAGARWRCGVLLLQLLALWWHCCRRSVVRRLVLLQLKYYIKLQR